jgi:hypothetical protein
MLKRAALVALCFGFLASAPSFAQEQATIVTKSGERISGSLVDMGGVGFTIRVGGNDRNVPTNDVAVIEFTGAGTLSADVRNRLNAGQQFVVLRNGQVIEGRLYDIGGTTPLRVTVDTPSGQRDLTSAEVAQVYLANPSAGGANAVATTGNNGTVTVPGNQEWVSTNINVNQGERLNISASGQVKYGPDREHTASVAGQRLQRSPNAPVPNAPLGSLIGRIDDGPAFYIGSSKTVTMPGSGTLHLRVNDDIVTDNSGSFQVRISK